MSRILDATCNAAGQVTADGIVVVGAVVLSEGKQASTGLLFLQGDLKVYLPSSATDVKSVIDSLSTALDDIATALTSIGGQITGLGGDGSTATSKATAILAIKTELDTLKGALK